MAERGNTIFRMMMMIHRYRLYTCRCKVTTDFMQVLTKDSRIWQKICEVVEGDGRNNAGVEWTRPLSTSDVIDYEYYLLKNICDMSRRTFN